MRGRFFEKLFECVATVLLSITASEGNQMLGGVLWVGKLPCAVGPLGARAHFSRFHSATPDSQTRVTHNMVSTSVPHQGRRTLALPTTPCAPVFALVLRTLPLISSHVHPSFRMWIQNAIEEPSI